MELHYLALTSAGIKLEHGPWEDDLKDVEGAYMNNRGEFIVAELDGKIVGMGAIRYKSEIIAEVKRMRVDPGQQRSGIGSRILAILEVKAKELGYKELHLDTSSQLVGAMNFYLKHGYVEFKRVKRDNGELVFFMKNIEDAVDYEYEIY